MSAAIPVMANDILASDDEVNISTSFDAEDATESSDNMVDFDVIADSGKAVPNTDPDESESTEKSAGISTRASTRNEVESNNKRTSADVMYIGDTMRGYMNSASDVDCFVFTPTSDYKVTVALTGPSGSSYDYDLWLQDASGNLLAQSTGSTSAEKLTYDAKSGTKYYIVVNTSKGYSTSTRYTVKLTGTAKAATSKTISVTAKKQEKTYWCWATTVQMIAATEGYSRTQTQIVTSIHGSAVNKTGNISQQVDALKLISSSTFKKADYNNCENTTQYKSLISDSVLAGKPVNVACCPDWKSIGHSYLVYAVDTNSNTLSMIDPWDASRVTRMSRSTFINGFYCAPVGKTVRSLSAITY